MRPLSTELEEHVQEVLEAFGLGQLASPAREVARGEMGHVVRADTTTGTWALKEYRAGTGIDGPGDLALQDAFMAAAARAGVYFPRPCRTKDDLLLAEVGGTRWKAFDWMDIVGTPSSREVGELLGRLHTVAWPTDRPVDPWYTERTEGGLWETLTEVSRGQDWSDLLMRQLPELIAQDEIVRKAQMPPARICHCDINEANVVLDSKGRVVVLDWDNCGPLALEREAAYVIANPLICPEPTEFIRAYRDLGGVFEPQGLDVFATEIAANNNYLAKLIVRSVEGDDWAHSMLLPMLEHPIRIANLERLLAAVQDLWGDAIQPHQTDTD